MHTDVSFLQGLWFVLIGVLWAGFFILEGFDFGVGVLVKGLAKDDVEKRMAIHTIGPVWDGNEVWLITVGGAMFAAFPGWYATTFSGFYLALFLVLASLIIRGVSFEFWGKIDSARWRSGWEWALAIASGAAALLFGVAWANFVRGVPMGKDGIVHVTLFFGLLHPYALLGGLTTLLLFTAHGAQFLSLRVSGELQQRAEKLNDRLMPAAAVVGLGFLVWTMSDHSWRAVVVGVGALTVVAALAATAVRRRFPGWGFGLTSLTILLLTATFCAALWPDALPSTTSPAYNLTLAAASSSHYTQMVMTVVAFVTVPIVLVYQSWSYWVFRHRLGRDQYEGALNPVAVIEQHFSGSES
ncbi:MAG: cytochrome d ubiquinol oxidase subunit II [Solirubrobacteraceae bacterium]